MPKWVEPLYDLDVSKEPHGLWLLGKPFERSSYVASGCGFLPVEAAAADRVRLHPTCFAIEQKAVNVAVKLDPNAPGFSPQ